MEVYKQVYKGMYRKSVHGVDELLKHVELHHTKKDQVEIDGDMIKIGSDRYKTFKFKGLVCVKCRLEGSFFGKEKNLNNTTWHMNLYGYNTNGEEILMTKDHILPICKGGKDVLDNYQPMCITCNFEKGGNLEPVTDHPQHGSNNQA